ncbi:MAG: hypothetical protein RLZZ437_2571 [Pseudomonadota bacterium]|jgi:hypothetical protein
MQWILVVAVALCLATSVQAQEAAEDEAAVMPAALSGVDGALAKRMQRDMGDVAADAMTLILGYGRDGAIDRAGIETWLAVERAVARAQVMRRMIEADLDADGTVTAAEIAVIAGAAEAGIRGRIMQNHALADSDGDGAVSAPEAAARAQGFAMDEVSEGDAARAMALMGLDMDGDGRLTLAEVDRAAQLMAAGG